MSFILSFVASALLAAIVPPGTVLQPVETLGLVVAAPPQAKPLTEQDYTEFGQRLESAVMKMDAKAFDQLVPTLDLFHKAIDDLEIPTDDFKALIAGAKTASGSLRQQFFAEIKKGGRYSFLHVRKLQGEERVLMRLIFQDGSVNYYDYFLHRNSDGKVVAEDIYIFMSGEMISTTLRRIMLVFLADPRKGLAEKLKDEDKLYLKNVSDVTKMTTAIRTGRNKEALAIFRKLPTELQADKALQLIAIKAAQEGDETEYLAELERFRKAHPKDAAIDFLSIDYYTIKKQYGEAVKAIESLDRAVAGDPFLQILKGGLLDQQGKRELAKQVIEKAIKDDPNILHGYWARIAISLEEKKHDETLAWLKKVEETGLVQLSIENIKAAEDYADFARSPEFKKLASWLAERKR